MGLVYEKIIRPILFSQDPEYCHDLTILGMRLLGRIAPLRKLMERYNNPSMQYPVELFGLRFPNPVGLAAGFDKNGYAWKAAAALGFGYVEIGTVTYYGQPGNPKPRLHRFKHEEAIINSLGFNNEGASAVAERLSSELESFKKKIPLGINIGKSRATPLDEAIEDYLQSFDLLANVADYFAINVSSPNTQGLRMLQTKDYLPELLKSLQAANTTRAQNLKKPLIPMLVKVSPDLSFKDLDEALEAVTRFGFAGVIATNTTTRRPGSFKNVDISGGLSGRPLHPYSVDIIRYIYKATQGKLPIIGVGGIMDPVTADETFNAGASLIQLYTGLIFKGPFLGRDIARALIWQKKQWI